MIERLAEQGATWVQFDEPCFVEDRSEKELDALRLAYEELCKVHERPRIVVKTYFDHVGDAYGVLRDLPIEGVGLDFTGSVHGQELDPDVHEHGGRHNAAVHRRPGGARGPVAVRRDRRRPQRLDQPPRALARRAGGTPDAAPPSSWSRRAARCSTRRSTSTPSRRASTPTSTTRCAPGWHSPSQKVGEVATLAKGVAEGREAIADELDANDRARDSRRDSERTSNAEVRARIDGLDEEHDQRSSPFEERRQAQRARIDIPDLFPSTTIGSYPQTDEIRQTAR